MSLLETVMGSRKVAARGELFVLSRVINSTEAHMNRTVRKVIIWGLIVVVALPNIVIGEPAFKLFGLVLAGGLIWWDVTASKNESGHSKAKK